MFSSAAVASIACQNPFSAESEKVPDMIHLLSEAQADRPGGVVQVATTPARTVCAVISRKARKTVDETVDKTTHLWPFSEQRPPSCSC